MCDSMPKPPRCNLNPGIWRRWTTRFMRHNANSGWPWSEPTQSESFAMRSTDHLDPFNLQRFLQAQDPVFDRVQDELNNGHKRSHWMWFIFPQFAGLGGSEMSRRFAIRSREEALAYLEHPLLGPRLRTCTQEVLNIRERSVAGIFGHPDDLKFQDRKSV